MKLRRRLAMLIAAVLLVTASSALVGCKKTYNDVLVVGYSNFSSKFSPFFAKTAYDQDVATMTQAALLTSDRQGNIIYNSIEGEKNQL